MEKFNLLLEQYGAHFRVALRNWNTKPIAHAIPITKRQTSNCEVTLALFLEPKISFQ